MGQSDKQDRVTVEGTVKFFDKGTGNGFIQRQGHADVFMNYEAIRGEDPRVLAKGDKVEVVVVAGPKGPRARSVRKL